MKQEGGAVTRRLFTTDQLHRDGLTTGNLRSLVAAGVYGSVTHGVYADAPGEPTRFETALGRMLHRGEPCGA